MPRILLALLPASLLVAACSDSPSEPFVSPDFGIAAAAADEPGAVYVLSNDPTDNAVLAFPRAPDGTLAAPAGFSTGGRGSGTGLGNQGGLVLVEGRRLLFAINPGSDQVTAFRIKGSTLDRIGTWSSGGNLPISIAVHGNLLYVLHDGASPGVNGFRIGVGGALHPVANSARALSGVAPDAAQASFSPNGRFLVVTEKATNLLVTFPVDAQGLLGVPVTTPSAAPTPFGFAFAPGGALLVSEAAGGAADASVLSSYRSGPGGWVGVSPATATTETAACWVALTKDGRFAYVTNTGSGTVSGFRVRRDGSLRLLDAGGVTGQTGAGPIDMDLVGNRYLYTLNAAGRSISAFSVSSDGDLTALGTTTGVPLGANGLQAH